MLVPTFALGRAQDVLLTLTRQLLGVPIYLDGLTREITRLFAAMPEHLPEAVRNQLKNGTNPFLGPQVTLVADRREREHLIRNPTPAVILASSGMLSQGVSPLYAKQVLQEPESAVLIEVAGYDWNCPQHITPRFSAEEWASMQGQDGSRPGLNAALP